MKVLILVTIIVLGFTKGAGHKFAGSNTSSAADGLRPSVAFSTERHDIASYTDSFMYVMYAFSGFEQPFYVLSEVSRPRKVFPKYTLLAMLVTATLFILVNLAYFCAVPKDYNGLIMEADMATIFFSQVFGDENGVPKRGWSIPWASKIPTNSRYSYVRSDCFEHFWEYYRDDFHSCAGEARNRKRRDSSIFVIFCNGSYNLVC